MASVSQKSESKSSVISPEDKTKKTVERLVDAYLERCLEKQIQNHLETHVEKHIEKHLDKHLEKYIEKHLEKKHRSQYGVRGSKPIVKEKGSQIYVEENMNKGDVTGTVIMNSHVSEFWSNISIPGIKYVGTNGYHTVDRYLWIVVLLFSVAISFHCIHNSYLKWRSSPVLLSFNDSMTHINAVPFPAVTVCPGRQISKYFGSNMKQHFNYCSANNHSYCKNNVVNSWDIMTAGGLLCPDFFKLETPPDKYLSETIDKKIKGYVSHCSDDTIWFKLNGDEYSYDCRKRFQTIFLSDGQVCFTFNMLPAHQLFHENVIYPMVDKTDVKIKPNWTLEKMFELADVNETVPRYINSSGLWEGLYFAFQKNETEDNLCHESDKKPKIVFHHPGVIPRKETQKFHDIPETEDTFFQLTPRLITSSPDLDSYNPEVRKCYYSQDIKLSLFRSYTQQNCRLECLVNCTLSLCDCVPFYFPRLNGTKICGINHTDECAERLIPGLLGGRYTLKEILLKSRDKLGDRLQELFLKSRYEGPYNIGGSLDFTEEILQQTHSNCRCNCPTACSSLEYDAEVVNKKQDDETSEEYKVTRLAISFKELEFTSIVRKELVGLTDFIADSGGVLGVFTGFTFLAVIEMLYFVTLRLWKNIKRSWDRQWEVMNVDGGRFNSLSI